MSCERLRSDLLDLALGAAGSHEARAHLASCAPCREASERLRAQASLMDEELRLAGGAEPGPHFLARVRGRLAADRAARPPALRFLVPVLASLLAIGVGLLLARRQPVVSPSQTASLPSPEPPHMEAPAGPAPPAPRPPAALALAREGRPAPERPVVLVDESESAALSVLAARLASRATRPESLQMPAADSTELKEIAIAPLDVRPLDTAPTPEDSTERSPS